MAGDRSQPIPSFSAEVVDCLLVFMWRWEVQRRAGRTQRFPFMIKLCHCYVEFLLYTGIRQGTEFMPIRWKEIQCHRADSEQYQLLSI